jgi:predicted DNA-binding protein with PD1-like motif
MQSHESSISRMIMIRVDPGEDLLDALQRAVTEHSVANGVFVSGAGSIRRYHFHVVSSTELPPENAFVEGDGAFDIVAITGAVLGGRVHAHITFTDDASTLGGHLEPGCEVLTFAMVALAETPAQDLSMWDHVPGRDRS